MSSSKKIVEGRVAAILNARELVINVGSENGVEPGMKFAVLAQTPLLVKDPMTGKELDHVDREKVRVQATEVRPKITICRTYRVKRIEGGLFGTRPWTIADLYRPAKGIPETLRIEDSSMPPPLSEQESYVKVKDRAIQVLDD